MCTRAHTAVMDTMSSGEGPGSGRALHSLLLASAAEERRQSAFASSVPIPTSTAAAFAGTGLPAMLAPTAPAAALGFGGLTLPLDKLGAGAGAGGGQDSELVQRRLQQLVASNIASLQAQTAALGPAGTSCLFFPHLHASLLFPPSVFPSLPAPLPPSLRVFYLRVYTRTYDESIDGSIDRCRHKDRIFVAMCQKQFNQTCIQKSCTQCARNWFKMDSRWV